MTSNKILYLLSAILYIIYSCEKVNDLLESNTGENSFLPMQVGNYWKVNEENYTEITDTVRIDGKLFYKFYSLTGGDGLGIQYLRIDEDQNLIESFPDSAEFIYTHAKFNANVNDVFYTINDKSDNDYKVRVVEKNDKRIKFEFQVVYHLGLNGRKHKVSYIKGIGWEDNLNEMRINGTVYK